MFRYFIASGALVFFLSGCGSTPSSAISGFLPIGATVGTNVTITGAGFDVGPVNNLVAFNGTAAVVTSSTPTQIVVPVPQNATSGPISITVDGVSHATSATGFTVFPAPTFTPQLGAPVGAPVTITVGFDPTATFNNTVTFNGTAATTVGITNTTPAQIVAQVPTGATSGPIVITAQNANGEIIYSLTTSTSFTVQPPPI